MKLIKLTLANSQGIIYVRPNNILYIYDDNGYTIVDMTDKSQLCVCETVNNVAELINKAMEEK